MDLNHANRLLPVQSSTDVNVIALCKGDERYVFLFEDQDKVEALRTFNRFASNPDLSFTWYDAATLSQKVRAIDGK